MTDNDAAPAGPVAVAELVSYQDGAVVSRKLVARTGGNVTAFAFDAGQELSEHATPFDALLHVVDGRAEIRIGMHKFTVKAGEQILLPANRPHAVRAGERFMMLLTMVRGG